MLAEVLAKKFHTTYEELAPQFGYETRKASAVPWEDVPMQNKALMIAVCERLLQDEPLVEDALRTIFAQMAEHGGLTDKEMKLECTKEGENIKITAFVISDRTPRILR